MIGNKVKRFFTTGDIARYCEVDVNTVKSWIRNNNLQAFTTPSGHYRVARSDFIYFIKKQGFTYEPAYFGENDHLTDFLIIENNRDQAETLTNLINNLYKDLRIEMVPDGFEGYLKISQHKPKLVILDLRLPRLTGLELLRVLRSHKETLYTKVLVISDYLEDRVLEELNEIGVDGVLFRPLNKSDLKEKCDPFFENAM